MSETPTRAWSPLPDITQVPLQIARQVAQRLCDDTILSKAIKVMPQQTSHTIGRRWEPPAIAEGDAGIALLCAQLDTCFPDEDWDRAAHVHLMRAVQAAQEAPTLQAGLLIGLSGLAFATWLSSREGSRYRKALQALEASLFPLATALSEQALEYTCGVPSELCDVYFGLGGIGAYLLCRCVDSGASATLYRVLTSLTHLTRVVDGLPCWHTPQFATQDEWLTLFPSGYINCGLAHGIPGMLAVLALAYRQGMRVEYQEAGMKRAADWIIAQQLTDEWGINWPTALPLSLDELAPAATTPARSGWCYGSPGIAQALWLAGGALDCATYRDLAIETMRAVFRRPTEARRLDSPTFCHGLASLLQITLRFAWSTRLPFFQEAARTVLAQILALYEPESLLGFRCKEVWGPLVDAPGVVDGAAGVALVLLAASTPQEPRWDRLFALS